jgi:hypothetical protein
MKHTGKSLLALLFGVLCLLGPALSSSCASRTGRPPHALESGPRHPELLLVSVLTPSNAEVHSLVSTLRSELEGEFDVAVTLVTSETTPTKLRQQLDRDAPKAVVLVDNAVAVAYRAAIASHPAPPPSVLVMNSFVDEVQPTIENSTAIGFEPPAVVTLTHVRSLLRRPVARAGVIYRAGFEAFIERERSRAKEEDIELVGVRVPRHPSVNAIGRALHRLERENLDAVWITNDNVLLTAGALARAWLPFAAKARIPIVVGVPGLVAHDGSFGTYAAVPDSEGLGLQAAEMIFRLEELGFRADGQAVEPPLSLRTYLHVERARTLGLPPEGEARVDVLLGKD